MQSETALDEAGTEHASVACLHLYTFRITVYNEGIVPKSMAFSDTVLKELPAGSMVSSSWSGHHTFRCLFQSEALWFQFKGSRKAKVIGARQA